MKKEEHLIEKKELYMKEHLDLHREEVREMDKDFEAIIVILVIMMMIMLINMARNMLG